MTILRRGTSQPAAATRHRSARLAASALGLSVLLAACGVDDAAPEPVPVQPPVVAPAPPDAAPPDRAPSPQPDPAAPTPEAEATRVSLLVAARAGDWDTIADLLPDDGFTASFGGETDAIAYYQTLPTDILAVIVSLLEGPSARFEPDIGLSVWPDLHARQPFVIAAEERDQLAAVYGEQALSNWEAAGSYLGWRIGIEDDGTWRFLVAGD